LATTALSPGGDYLCDERRRKGLHVKGRVQLLRTENSATHRL